LIILKQGALAVLASELAQFPEKYEKVTAQLEKHKKDLLCLQNIAG